MPYGSHAHMNHARRDHCNPVGHTATDAITLAGCAGNTQMVYQQPQPYLVGTMTRNEPVIGSSYG